MLCVFRYKNADGKYVVRPYTPIMNSEKGFMSLVIKVGKCHCFVCVLSSHCRPHAQEYPEGNMSKHVHEMEVGDVKLSQKRAAQPPHLHTFFVCA